MVTVHALASAFNFLVATISFVRGDYWWMVMGLFLGLANLACLGYWVQNDFD